MLSSFVMIGSCDYVVIILDLVVRYSTKNLSINIEGTGMAADVEIKTNFEFFFFDRAYADVPYRTVRCKLHTRVTVIRLFSS